MVSKDRHNRAVHEAGHAVIARNLGIPVPRVTVRSRSGQVVSVSAGYHAVASDVAARIVGHEADAKFALAGLAANRRDHPHLSVFDLFEEDDDDTNNVRGAIYAIVRLRAGEPPQVGLIRLDPIIRRRMDEEYRRLVAETAALVDQCWPAIRRVATHLERHADIDQADELDRLIAIGMRNS